MSDESAKKRAEDAAEAETAEDAEATAEAEIDPLAALETENAELRDQSLRLAAEMENLRKRTARDVRDARAFAIANFARDMLGVGDNLTRALEAVPEESRKHGDEVFKGLVDGVELTAKDMLVALERHGVKKLAPEGERFDPNFHQAMFEVPNTEVPANTVVQVVQEGYVIGERVLRPAMVGVAKGGPKQAAANDSENTEPSPPNVQAEKDA